MNDKEIKVFNRALDLIIDFARESKQKETHGSVGCSVNELQEKIDRLIYHCAALGCAVVDDNTDIANESWRSLPDDLQELINIKTEQLSEGC